MGFLEELDPVSRDQNAHVEPCLGGGVVTAAIGGASCMSTFAGALVVSCGASGAASGSVGGGAVSCEGTAVVGAVLLPYQNPNHELPVAAAGTACAVVSDTGSCTSGSDTDGSCSCSGG